MRKVTLGTTIAYGMPGLGAGYMYLLMSLYVMKFSPDVLLIAPAVMGVIFSISRIWDAVSDPIAGYLSYSTGASCNLCSFTGLHFNTMNLCTNGYIFEW